IDVFETKITFNPSGQPLAPASLCLLRPVHQAVGAHGAVQRTATGAADGRDAQISFLHFVEQPIEHATCERGVRAATLEAQSYNFACACHTKHLLSSLIC